MHDAQHNEKQKLYVEDGGNSDFQLKIVNQILKMKIVKEIQD